MSIRISFSDEYEQALRERQIEEAYELHGWATSISTASPLDILIMLEEDDDEYHEPTTNGASSWK